MHLAERSWTDADAADVDVALLPVGSTEQHGPHAPLGTDVLTAEAVAAAGVAATDRPVVVGPTVPVGIAAEHRQFTGTCWVSPDTFRDYVRETLASLASHGWDRLVVVNGHGGNVAALREVCGDLARAETALAVPFTWFDAVDVDRVGAELADGDEDEGQDAVGDGSEDADGNGDRDAVVMGHGGAAETSVLRHVRPDLVDEARFAEARDGAADAWGEWAGGSNVAYDTAEFSENGVVGDPTASDPAVGEALLDAAGDRLADLVDAVATGDVERPPHR